jgi:hypothetical protein
VETEARGFYDIDSHCVFFNPEVPTTWGFGRFAEFRENFTIEDRVFGQGGWPPINTTLNLELIHDAHRHLDSLVRNEARLKLVNLMQ